MENYNTEIHEAILDTEGVMVAYKIIGSFSDYDAVKHQYLVNHNGEALGYSAIYVAPTAPTLLELTGLTITRNGGDVVPNSGNKYYLDPGDRAEVTGTIVGGEAIDAAIIKLPITRHADDLPTEDELYFTGSIVAGVLTVSGTFTLSSNYKALMSRCNRALDRMPAGFHVNFEDIDFLV